MAVYEESGVLKYKDESGKVTEMYPITKVDNVEGLADALAEKETSGAATQALSDAKSYTDTKVANAQTLDLPVTASSPNGTIYVATVSGISSLTAGQSFIMVPNITSASTTPTLNVNGTGSKTLRMRGGDYTSTTITPSNTTWLAANKPVRVTYDGTFWVCDLYPAAESDITYGTTDLTAGSSSLATGKLYVVYE